MEDEQRRFHGDFKLIGRLLKFVLTQWRWVAVAVALAFIITGATLTWPKLLQLAMDKYILNGSLPLAARINGVTHIAFIFLAVIATAFIANFFQVIALEWAGQKIMDALRQSLFQPRDPPEPIVFQLPPGGEAGDQAHQRYSEHVRNVHLRHRNAFQRGSEACRHPGSPFMDGLETFAAPFRHFPANSAHIGCFRQAEPAGFPKNSLSPGGN